MADKHTRPVVVIGLGRFGGSLALELDRRGVEVLAIDSDRKIVQGLADRLPQVAAADTTDDTALQQLGVGDFEIAVVGIGTDVEASILTTSLLGDLGVDQIWAKAISRQHGRILERIGAHHVVYPEHDMGERVAHLVDASVLDYMEVEDDFAVVKVRPTQEVVGRPLAELDLWSRHAVAVTFVKHPDGAFVPATDDTVLTYDDVILIGGKPEAVERFSELS
ncbi:potassium channel family protein [Flindersiella endophytica]